MTQLSEFARIWDFYKPRHTHAWNMLVLAFRELERCDPEAVRADGETVDHFEVEYAWENVIVRLWLYRTVVRTLSKLPPVVDDASQILRTFDQNFQSGGVNALKALRDMIEHFDDYAAGEGRGPVTREHDLDPWRLVTVDEYQRGSFKLSRRPALLAADRLRSDARRTSDKFVELYKLNVG